MKAPPTQFEGHDIRHVSDEASGLTANKAAAQGMSTMQ